MKFTFHNWYIIIELVPSTVIFWTELSRLHKSNSDFLNRAQSLTQKLLKQDYIAPRLKSSLQKFYSSHHNLRIWLTVTKYQYLKWQWIFYFIRRLFFPLSLSVLLPDLTLYMSNMVYTVNTWVHPLFFGGVRVPHIFSFLCCSIMCLYVLSSMLWCPLRFPHKKQCLVRLYPKLFVGGLMSYLCLFAYKCCPNFRRLRPSNRLPVSYYEVFSMIFFQSSGINVEVII
jgi:hypothetical protein